MKVVKGVRSTKHDAILEGRLYSIKNKRHTKLYPRVWHGVHNNNQLRTASRHEWLLSCCSQRGYCHVSSRRVRDFEEGLSRVCRTCHAAIPRALEPHPWRHNFSKPTTSANSGQLRVNGVHVKEASGAKTESLGLSRCNFVNA